MFNLTPLKEVGVVPDHPIENLMKTAMENIKEMIDVDVVVGDPVEVPDGMVIMPVSRVSCGFAAGGSNFCSEKNEENVSGYPFGGGSGGGISVRPVGFLVVGKESVRFLSIDGNPAIDRLIDMTPLLMDKVRDMLYK